MSPQKKLQKRLVRIANPLPGGRTSIPFCYAVQHIACRRAHWHAGELVFDKPPFGQGSREDFLEAEKRRQYDLAVECGMAKRAAIYNLPVTSVDKALGCGQIR